MTDKQRADHVQAKYWGGPISRAEAQKVFDEYGQVITAQAKAIQKLDTVITYMTNKLGVTIEDVNKWVEEKLAEAAAKAKEATPETPNANSQSEQR